MVDLIIRDKKLAARLRDLAQEEERPIEEILQELLDQYQEAPKPGSFRALLRSAVSADIESEQLLDTSSRVNDILREEYARHLKQDDADE